MLNALWVGFILIAFLIALFKLLVLGDADIFAALVRSLFDSSKTAFEIALGLTGVMALWLGVMKIGERAGMLELLTRGLAPLFRRLFPEVPANHPALGAMTMNMGANIARQGGVEIDLAAFVIGLQDGLSGAKPRVSEADLQAAFKSAQAKIESAASAGAAKQAQAGQKFLADNQVRAGVVTTQSGLQYEVLREGTGPKPKSDQSVEVHYHGTLIDGTVFDSSVSRGEPISFPVTGVIPGWVEALQLMSVGSKWKLFIPADLAYGNRAQGAIPAGSVLVFEVELLGIE
jgi:FKBP-type peptidyl-prolyl cis-trans isomerase FklB